MSNRVQKWIYNKGGYFWFLGWSHKLAKREGNHYWKGVRWRWLVKVLRIITGCKFSYWKDLNV